METFHKCAINGSAWFLIGLLELASKGRRV